MRNALSLEEFRKAGSLHPYHFWGITGAALPVKSACNDVMYEYAWQAAEAAGRYDIAEAINVAENKARNHLRFNPAPKFDTFSARIDPEANIENDYVRVQAPFGYVISGGVETTVLIEDSVEVVYSDLIGLGYNTQFEITLSLPAVIAVDEIRLYFNSDDRGGEEVNEQFEIRPIRCSYSGNILTIKGRAPLMVIPSVRENTTVPVDYTDSDSFASTVDIYRVYAKRDGITESDAEAIFIWDAESGDPAETVTAIGRIGIVNAKQGIIKAAPVTWNESAGIFSVIPMSRPPDRVTLNLYSGFERDPSGLVSNDMRNIIFKIAAAEMPRKVSTCDSANRIIWDCQADLARSSGTETFGYISREALNNPVGTRRGQVEAWQLIIRYMLLQAFSV